MTFQCNNRSSKCVCHKNGNSWENISWLHPCSWTYGVEWGIKVRFSWLHFSWKRLDKLLILLLLCMLVFVLFLKHQGHYLFTLEVVCNFSARCFITVTFHSWTTWIYLGACSWPLLVWKMLWLRAPHWSQATSSIVTTLLMDPMRMRQAAAEISSAVSEPAVAPETGMWALQLSNP